MRNGNASSSFLRRFPQSSNCFQRYGLARQGHGSHRAASVRHNLLELQHSGAIDVDDKGDGGDGLREANLHSLWCLQGVPERR